MQKKTSYHKKVFNGKKKKQSPQNEKRPSQDGKFGKIQPEAKSRRSVENSKIPVRAVKQKKSPIVYNEDTQKYREILKKLDITDLARCFLCLNPGHFSTRCPIYDGKGTKTFIPCYTQLPHKVAIHGFHARNQCKHNLHDSIPVSNAVFERAKLGGKPSFTEVKAPTEGRSTQ